MSKHRVKNVTYTPSQEHAIVMRVHKVQTQRIDSVEQVFLFTSIPNKFGGSEEMVLKGLCRPGTSEKLVKEVLLAGTPEILEDHT